MICSKGLGVDDPSGYEVLNSRNSPLVGRAVDYLYARLQRKGMLRREIERMVNQDRNFFAAAMLALGEADAMITGTTRPYSQSLKQVQMVIGAEEGAVPFGINIIIGKHHTVLIADTAVTERPDRAGTCGDRDPLGGLRAPARPGTAHRLHQLHDLRQSARRPYRGIARCRETARHDGHRF